MTSSSSLYLALIFLILETAFADSNFFFDDDSNISDEISLDTNYQDFFSSSDESFPIDDNAQTSIFANLPDDQDIWNDNGSSLLSSCIIDENGQTPPPLRARDNKPICPQQNSPPPPPPPPPPPSTFTPPKLPDFTDIENALGNHQPVRPSSSSSSSSSSGGPERNNNRPTGPYLPLVLTHSDHRVLYGNEPEYYCNLYVSYITRPTPYLLSVPPTIPVCGSGRASDRYGNSGLFSYRGFYNGRLLFPASIWECPESELFCCKVFEPADGSPVINANAYHHMIDDNDIFNEGMGRGEECRNLKEAGWRGYDSDKERMFPQENPDDLGIIDP